MQEEITQKTLALCVETGKMTAQLLQQAMKKVLADMEKIHLRLPSTLETIQIFVYSICTDCYSCGGVDHAKTEMEFEYHLHI